MPTPDTIFTRLMAHWVYGGALAGVLLLALAPLLVATWPWGEVLAFLALPAYMLHQWEEHDDDRFRRFVNSHLAGGAEALSIPAVFWINIVGVWAVLAAALWLMRLADGGWGVVAAWLLLVNALGHLGQALALRRPNPGLWTGLALFLPLGLAILWALWPETAPAQHLLALVLVLGLHAAIARHVRLASQRAPR